MKLIPLCYVLLTISLSSFAMENAGKTAFARGEVNAFTIEDSRLLKRRSPVFIKDTITTGTLSDTQLRMVDGGILTLQQESQFAINDYQFNHQNSEGNVSLSLLKGGLRTLTGTLKATPEHYKLQTPVASIGVRGTHYEAELIEGDLYLGVWNGNVDVQVTVGLDPLAFSLGDNEDFRFAIVKSSGEVDFIVSIPQAFTQGHSESLLSSSTMQHKTLTLEERALLLRPLTARIPAKIEEINELDGEFDQTGDGLLDNDTIWSDLVPTHPDIIASRSGSVSFDHILEQGISSTAGPIHDLSMNMTVNFDTARVSDGELSFSDAQGEWFAAFNGIFNVDMLEVNVNFASHGNNLAEGEIQGIFLNNASQILGDFSLHEINNSSVSAGGTFLLGEHP